MWLDLFCYWHQTPESDCFFRGVTFYLCLFYLCNYNNAERKKKQNWRLIVVVVTGTTTFLVSGTMSLYTVGSNLVLNAKMWRLEVGEKLVHVEMKFHWINFEFVVLLPRMNLANVWLGPVSLNWLTAKVTLSRNRLPAKHLLVYNDWSVLFNDELNLMRTLSHQTALFN